ncbi:penicillin-binding protein 1B [Pseudomonadota bacterium]
MPKTKKRRSSPRGKALKKNAKPRRSLWRLTRSFVLALLLPALVCLGVYVLYLDYVVQDKFEGKRWAIPSRVYARALELYPAQPLTAKALHAELKLIGYQASSDGLTPGTYSRNGNRFVISTRAFMHWDSQEPARSIRLKFRGDRLHKLSDTRTGKALSLVRIEPMQIGTIYPAHKEDRILVQLDELPPVLLDALKATEDRKFQSHIGIDFFGIGRAMLANIRAGAVVQGGSTLTQQLVKNFYLNSERTLTRKFNEAIMALLLEAHYEKHEILEAYANEIYLGQDGARAVHGFGLASEFYFNKPSSELDLAESALLVAILRGPAYYDPRRHPERAKKRRDQIIDTLWVDGVIGDAAAQQAKRAVLGIAPKPNRGTGRYPAFIDLVKRHLRADYREEDLRSEGLRIFTTLDPYAQQVAERALTSWIERIERDRSLPVDMLQGGVVLTHQGSAEISAVVGGRNVRYEGFNRALDIQRPVGSLLKPALYLSALSQGYTLTSVVRDEAVEIRTGDGELWAPENYDHEIHGDVTVIDALANSYNLAAVNLGVKLGIEQTVHALHNLGIERELPHYYSLLLGAVEMAPIDIAQMYQTLADEGFYTPLRSVREVLTQKGEPLQRYPLNTEKRFEPEAVYLVSHALAEAFRNGTGRTVAQYVPQDIPLVGKTGTTDDLRDSWFAGFGNEYIGVVWLGGDDNQVTGLTGASGALQVWADIMTKISPRGEPLPPPPGIEIVQIDVHTGLQADSGCPERSGVPFVSGSAPQAYAPCAHGNVKRSIGGAWESFKGFFQ